VAAINLRRVSKLYGQVRALDDVSLDVAEGELVALLGSSGCGKTTLLRSVAGLETPTSGEIAIGGRDVTSVPTRQRPIGMVFQSYALFPNMTVRQNIAFPLDIRRHPQGAIRKRVDELLELVRLTEQAERFPNQISGGQQQRGALARALAPEPEVLLLDEPLSALDAQVRTLLRDEIRRIQQTVGITTLYVTHDQAEAMAIADRVAVMSRGKIEQIATPTELYDAPATRFSAAFVGNRNALELPVTSGKVRLGEAFEAPAPAEANGRALVFFRPEDIELGVGSQPATVEARVFQGLLTRLHLVVEAEGATTRLFADLPTRQAAAIATGETVMIRVNPQGVRVFAAE
jgi:putative spermidine/putrescine transport system ATP-binding protein